MAAKQYREDVTISPTPLRDFHSKIAGVTHGRRQEDVRLCQQGDSLILRREPTNRYDRSAIAVLNRGGVMLGYIAAELAEDLAPLLDNGVKIECCVSSVTGGGGSGFFGWLFGRPQHSGVNIHLEVYGKVNRVIVGGDDLTVEEEVQVALEAHDFSRLEKVLQRRMNNLEDRHFLLQNIVQWAYSRRKEHPWFVDVCETVGRLHLKELPKIEKSYMRREGTPLSECRVSTFQHLATLLTEVGKFDDAMAVCQEAISRGYSDNTKGGYEGRIQQILKKKAKAN